MELLLTVSSAVCRVPVPAGWCIADDSELADARVATEAPVSDDGGFLANLVLTAADDQAGSFRDWQVATDQLLPEMLHDFLLIDLERRDVAGHPGGRRLAHHVTPDGTAVTMEQWFTLVDGIGWTFTATIDSLRYDEFADVFGEAADAMQVSRERAR